MADWEVGLAIAELNSQRFFVSPREFQVKTFSLSQAPVKTIGGVTLIPDLEISEVKVDDAVMLILPGSQKWMQPDQIQVLQTAKLFIDAGIPVAAICGATAALANAGMLDNVKHTSNHLEYLKQTCPNYHGAALYQSELAVTDGNIITAGSSSSVEFAYHILKKLAVFKPEALEYWYGYFGKHSDEIFKLFASANKTS
jgi:putative intracellular protease/amidase